MLQAGKLLSFTLQPHSLTEEHLMVEAAAEGRARLGHRYLHMGLKRFLVSALLKIFAYVGSMLSERSSVETVF